MSALITRPVTAAEETMKPLRARVWRLREASASVSVREPSGAMIAKLAASDAGS